MRLDPEERIIDHAALNQANERAAGARIEFSREARQGAASKSGWPYSAAGVELHTNR